MWSRIRQSSHGRTLKQRSDLVKEECWYFYINDWSMLAIGCGRVDEYKGVDFSGMYLEGARSSSGFLGNLTLKKRPQVIPQLSVCLLENILVSQWPARFDIRGTVYGWLGSAPSVSLLVDRMAASAISARVSFSNVKSSTVSIHIILYKHGRGPHGRPTYWYYLWSYIDANNGISKSARS